MRTAMVLPYSVEDEKEVKALLLGLDWSERYMQAQIYNLGALSESTQGQVLVAKLDDKAVALLQVQHHPWNKLSQVMSLAVSSSRRRQGLASLLLQHAEAEARERGQRGIYADLPFENNVGRALYLKQGYSEAYRMPQYYAAGLDGATFLKLF